MRTPDADDPWPEERARHDEGRQAPDGDPARSVPSRREQGQDRDDRIADRPDAEELLEQLAGRRSPVPTVTERRTGKYRLDRCYANRHPVGMPTHGMDLRIERVRANVTVTALAARMGISRQAVWGIERAAAVNAERTRQYREALQAIATGTVTAQEAVA